jgi:hypothetical protein
MPPAVLNSRVDDVRLVVRARREMTQEEFDTHLAEAMAMADRVRVVLVLLEDGAQISPGFRARLMRTGLFTPPTAVLTDSFLARVEMSSVSRIGANVRAFSPGEIDRAFEFLAIPARLRGDILTRLGAMQRELFGVPAGA